MPTSETRTARGQYRNGLRTRLAIVETASRVFAERGYLAGSLRQIAQEVGVSPAAVARHFSSKEELLVAVIRDSGSRAARAYFGDAEGLDYFDRAIDLVRHITRDRGMVELLMTLAAEATSPEHPARELMAARYGEIVRTWTTHLAEARDRGEVRRFTDRELGFEARGFFAMMDGLQLQWLLDPAFDLVAAWEHHYRATRARWTDGA